MKIPTAKVMKAAKKRAREGQPRDQRAPAPKRRLVQTPPPAPAPPPAPSHPPSVPEVDLTADTPPEVGATAGATAEEPEVGAHVPAGDFPAVERASPLDAARDWGEGPSVPASPSPEGPLGSGPHTEPGSSGAAERGEGAPRQTRDVLDDGRWAERTLGPIFDLGVIEDLSHMGAGAFFRDSYAAVVKIAHSLRAAREVIQGGKKVLRETQKEAEEARHRAEKAERALEAVKDACASEVRTAVGRAEMEANRARAALSQMAEAESAVMARNMHISELTSALQEAENRAGAAAEEARMAREEINKAREAERTMAEALAAEKARAAGLVEEYKASDRFTDDLAEASAAVYLDGFQHAKERVARDLNFPRALEIELSDQTSSDDEPAPGEP